MKELKKSRIVKSVKEGIVSLEEEQIKFGVNLAVLGSITLLVCLY